ncbi:cytosolic Fe-S cluster assembly factor nbp35 [Friedmanniomyces endolithicus]|uniref:Cytosolic Fe-S cluster assembly factor nbp35 n=1 Tax=Friedmanniomyces endolithicus TaxID=329885 RepID=A0AAN6F5E1_9PEZI|nr:cytosolic Fe-S cluster assembly factor nbp35 [Friedmanniomyces endolithicus]KAK0303183.1 cytosolic Fe-S cluster assembly factor nbp35 [Friedmanniomyces endolithicus]KAK0971146.1 cytosolic Fe-S cluster assembly factor nbp35 [Friedmanniomyces endolithicus]
MSVQFMLPNRDDAVIWRGAKKNGLIKQFLKDVEWGGMDYLVIDTAPGTSDEPLSLNGYLKESGVDGADGHNSAGGCATESENMSGFVGPKCTHTSEIFRATTGGGGRLAQETGIPFLRAVR